MRPVIDRDLPELLPESRRRIASSQEQIRVRAELLDSLVNHAGEVAIYRSRLEQQVAGYRFNLVELEQTVAVCAASCACWRSRPRRRSSRASSASIARRA